MLLHRQRAGGSLFDEFLLGFHKLFIPFAWASVKLPTKARRWFKPLALNEWALMVLNRNKESRPVTFDWKTESVVDELSKRDAAFDRTRYQLRNLWNGQFAGSTAKPLKAEVGGHDVLVLRLIPNK